ncbi:MAG: porin [Alphaproteobacteria bacterium]|uniref:Porin n=1 Tax=Candidatus Nitrobium versatile TaxID=2884831 RepID=A0A953J969_9BACT|nr:porin [Candidatus Nitrobium versatile]
MKKLLASVLLLFLVSSAASAQTSDERIKQLESLLQNVQEELRSLKDEQKKQGAKIEEAGVLKEEMRKLRLDVAMPEIEYKSYAGLGPAASKIYYTPRGLSIGGYGEIVYSNYFHSSKTDKGDVYRFIPYFGYKFSDKILMNAEVEFEHGGNDISVEFVYLDFMLDPRFNIRPGLILVPISRTNEYHEPTVFYGTFRPDVESQVIPTTWRELGVMAYGDLGKGFSYKAALINGLKTDNISDWIRSGRQNGKESNYNKFAGVVRLDYSGVPGLVVGGSAYYGGAENKGGGSERGTEKANIGLYVLEAQYQTGNAFVKGLYAFGDASGNEAYEKAGRAKQVYGWYAETGYNIFPHIRPESVMSLTPFARYERYNLNDEVFTGSPNESKDREVFTVGLDFKPHPQIVIKADYQMRDTESSLPEGKGTGFDENKINQFNVGLGFIF